MKRLDDYPKCRYCNIHCARVDEDGCCLGCGADVMFDIGNLFDAVMQEADAAIDPTETTDADE